MRTSLLEKVAALQPLPFEQNPIPPGEYTISTSNERKVESVDDNVKAEVWFKTEALSLDSISRLKSIQLIAESHDQGFADVPSAGNWTWFEIAVLEDETAWTPRCRDGVDLVWKSHYNRFMKKEYGWAEGKVFDKNHDLFGFLEEGNVIAVRLCARFGDWTIMARNGYLVINVGAHEMEREPPSYAQVIAETKRLRDVFTEVNLQTGQLYLPDLPEGLFQAESLASSADRPLRVLSLDGGGVRGLSALHLLKAVLDKVAPGQEPYQIFDMIGGTSTGGFIAIMLGRLHMTIDECILQYRTFMTKIFNKSKLSKLYNFGTKGEFYDAAPLEAVIKDLVRDRLGDENAPLLEEEPECRIFVTAVRRTSANNRGPVFLRSYKNPLVISELADIPIWKAARATSAAPAYFPPMRVEGYDLIDGGLQANNPLGWLWTEVLGVFGPARSTNCFLSIGTGMPANKDLPKFGVLGSHQTELGLVGIATNTEIVNILFRTLIDAFAPSPGAKKYWRLNVSTKIVKGGEDDYEDPGALDDVPALRVFLESTESYIRDHSDIIAECAGALSKKV